MTSPVTRGACELREQTCDVRPLELAGFRRWLAGRRAHWQRDAVFVQRARIRDLRRAHPRLRALEEEPRQAADAATEVGRLDRHQDLHPRHDLQRYSVSQERRARASASAAS